MTITFKLLSYIFLTTILLIGLANSEVTITKKINEATALELAAEAVYGRINYLKEFDYEQEMTAGFGRSLFFVFNGESTPPAEGSFGYFAVNPWTGDVWALWGCHKLSTPALRKSQAAIRRRFTRTELKQYARLRRLKPLCIVED